MAASKNIRLKISVHNKINFGPLTAKMNANEKRKFRQEIEKRMINAQKKITSVAVKNMVQSTVLNLRKINKEEAHIKYADDLVNRYISAIIIFASVYVKTPVDELYTYTVTKKYHRTRKYKDEYVNGKKTGRRVAVKPDVTYTIIRTHIPDDIRTKDYWKLKISDQIFTPQELGFDKLDEKTGYKGSGRILKFALTVVLARLKLKAIRNIHIYNDNPIENQYARLEYGLYQCADTNPVHYGSISSKISPKSNKTYRGSYNRSQGRPHGVKKGYSVQAPKGIARLVLAEAEDLNDTTLAKDINGLKIARLMKFSVRRLTPIYARYLSEDVKKKLKAGNKNIYEVIKLDDKNTEEDVYGMNKINGKLNKYKKQRILNRMYLDYVTLFHTNTEVETPEEQERFTKLLKTMILASIEEQENKITNEIKKKNEDDLVVKVEKETKVIKAKKKVVVKKKIQPKKKSGLVGRFGEKIIKSADWTETIAGILAPDDWDEASLQEDPDSRIIAIDEMGEEWVAFTDKDYTSHFGPGWHHFKEIESEIQKLDMSSSNLDKLR